MWRRMPFLSLKGTKATPGKQGATGTSTIIFSGQRHSMQMVQGLTYGLRLILSPRMAAGFALQRAATQQSSWTAARQSGKGEPAPCRKSLKAVVSALRLSAYVLVRLCPLSSSTSLLPLFPLLSASSGPLSACHACIRARCISPFLRTSFLCHVSLPSLSLSLSVCLSLSHTRTHSCLRALSLFSSHHSLLSLARALSHTHAFHLTLLSLSLSFSLSFPTRTIARRRHCAHPLPLSPH